MSGPKWFLKYKHYGHIDFYNPEYWNYYGCPQCDLPHCSFTDYRDGLKIDFTDIIQAIYHKDKKALESFEAAETHHMEN